MTSDPERALETRIIQAGLPRPEQEWRFHPVRKWRFDFAYPALMVAVEIEGGTWSGGRHTRGDGYEKDCEKYNTAALMGWKVIRLTTGMIADGRAIEWIGKALEARG